MLASRVSLAAIGSLKKLPSYSDIELGLLDKEVSYTNNIYRYILVLYVTWVLSQRAIKATCRKMTGFLPFSTCMKGFLPLTTCLSQWGK